MSDHPSFQSIFFSIAKDANIRVPDYQRAYAWEKKQTDLFVSDLAKYCGKDQRYYFGHFIMEDTEGDWAVVDGQQRMTTFVLFLMVCRVLRPTDEHADGAYQLIERFKTVSYDREALETIGRHLSEILDVHAESGAPSDEMICDKLKLRGPMTRSQRRMVLALLRFHQAFQKGGQLERDQIPGYLDVVMSSHCSHHLTKDKSVAVNIFEMHNTRGIPLTTLEIIKAMLMKFVYDHGRGETNAKVAEIQAEFGEIYAMEERMADHSFRGDMTMEQLIRMHLRTVDDGMKKTAKDLDDPPENAGAEAMVVYVSKRLHEEGAAYALNLARELKKSAGIVSNILPVWDEENRVVGDVMVLEKELSCQFFLIVCRRLESAEETADGRVDEATLLLWERLLFTRDFHGAYYNLKAGRDNFPALYAACACAANAGNIQKEVRRYLADGFREGRTNGLQALVAHYLTEHKERFLKEAFHWWKHKVIYAIYKFESSHGVDLRRVMKGTVSVEHVLPQEWQWLRDEGKIPELVDMPPDEWKSFREEIDGWINGLGNLFLITPQMNTEQGNKHPAEKRYQGYCSKGSYAEHDRNRKEWRAPKKWQGLIQQRGEAIFDFMLERFVGREVQPST